MGFVTSPFVVLAALAMAPAAVPTPAPPAAATQTLPDEAIVLELRRARVAGQAGARDQQRELLDALVASHPSDPTALTTALAFHREVDGDAESTRSLRARLLAVLAQPGQSVPLPLLQEVARDKKASEDELARLLTVLIAEPGAGAERLGRLRLRVELLDRLDRREELVPALEELAGVDPDPFVAYRLLDRLRGASRWQDVLRVAARIDIAQSGLEFGWWRLEAFAALSRYDEMSAEAQALIGRSRTPPALAASLSPYVAEQYFPYVFLLFDSGRREPAERLVAAIETANPGVESVKRLHVMLFGSPEDRLAFLSAAAGASLASQDPDKIRAEAYQRLLARDYATAHQLYKRLQALDPAVASLDGADWFNDGLAAIETEAWADAESAMSRVVATGGSQPRALAHRARAKVMQGRAFEGIADAEAALAIDPKLKQACYALYLAYQKLGDKAKADAWLARWKAP